MVTSDNRLELLAIGLGLCLVGLAIRRIQAKARTCPRHSRLTGRIGVLLGWLAFVAGVVVIVFAASH